MNVLQMTNGSSQARQSKAADKGNAKSKLFVSHIVNSNNQNIAENQGSQNKAQSKLILSPIMNSNNVNGSNNKRRNQVQVKLVFYVILCASIAKSL